MSYRTEEVDREVVADVSFDIAAGESFGLVGESGSGKSTIALALTRYLPRTATVTADQLTVAGEQVASLGKRALRRYRSTAIGVVYQEPGLALNPTSSVGEQLAEVYRLHGSSAKASRSQTIAAMELVGLPDPARIVSRYPHELSGGQQQRVVIAMALATRPALLILDEPTTGLDSNVEADILALIDRLQADLGFATLLISHNLPLVATHCRRIGVLQNGVLVETGEAGAVIDAPQHPYAQALVAALPDLEAPRAVRAGHTGRAHEAISVVDRAAGRSDSPLVEAPLVQIRALTKRYGTKLALDGVDLTLGRGEVLGIVGESGSGKTTFGRAVAGLTTFEGSITFADASDATGATDATDAPLVSVNRTKRDVPPVQIVFQSPDASLNPRRTVRQVLSRSITLLGGDTDAVTLAESTGLPIDALDKFPHELSGGQKQRVAIARAFAGPVPLVVCDEPTSALDVSVQARILDLLAELQERTGVSYLFITHDLAVVRRIADRIAVLNHGSLVDVGATEEVFAGGRHPYTESLIGAARRLRSRGREREEHDHRVEQSPRELRAVEVEGAVEGDVEVGVV
ncbi:ATP-binding cassette domain-containing protein [Plantibacter sp. YIM 135249]|uniref:ATP-binding cassette domain-containing protein n=1 Tax=Plantibacter sp. YIM 135249 TaxID=3423918 RepID=UPI003D32520E